MSQRPGRRLTRRTFVKAAGLFGATPILPTANLLAATLSRGRIPDGEVDVAIVGGGVSGVYCAWRLQQADPGRRIVVLEQSDRIGGRLMSARPPGIPNMVAELGGMRFKPAVHTRLVRLVEALNRALPEAERLESYPFPRSDPQNIAFLRGTRLRRSDFVERPDLVPYQLSEDERGVAPQDLVYRAFERIVPGITDSGRSADERWAMVQNASFEGVPLYRQGYWNAMARALGFEARAMTVDAGGYASRVTNQNAADAIHEELSDLGVDPSQRSFRDGYQSVPEALARLFARAGGTVWLESPVRGLEWFDDAVNLHLDGGTIRARAAILAMPRRALELLAVRSRLLQDIDGLLSLVLPVPAMKVFAAFEEPWWRTIRGPAPIEKGESVTDLPMRQVYYWPRTDGRPVTEGRAMLMATYNDSENLQFWDALRSAPGEESVGAADRAELFAGSCAGTADDLWCRHRAPVRIIQELSRQLALVHGLSELPEIVDAVYRNWEADPFGGGWHHWKVGVRSTEAMERIYRPFDSLPLYICGEAYSTTNGWVEGALQTADLVLRDFGIPPL
jgi:monoamine oxidase